MQMSEVVELWRDSVLTIKVMFQVHIRRHGPEFRPWIVLYLNAASLKGMERLFLQQRLEILGK